MKGAQDDAKINSARFKSLNGNEIEIRARAFVICCSGIENARILLNLPEPILSNINKHDNVGRFFAQHPRGRILTLEAANNSAPALQKLFNCFIKPRRGQIQYEVGFALSDTAQREYQLLNASAAIYYEESERSAWASAKRLRATIKSRTVPPGGYADVKNLLCGVPAVVANLVRKFILGTQRVIPHPIASVVVDLEQEPNRDSRITLSDDVDELEVRRVKVDWKISEIERRTAREFAKIIALELENMGFGRAELEPWLTSDAPIRDGELSGTYHFIGATRMASTPETGVVDKDCRVFGLDNLYMAGCSVFPTTGHANPTLTIVALAIRLADHLCEGLVAPPMDLFSASPALSDSPDYERARYLRDASVKEIS